MISITQESGKVKPREKAHRNPSPFSLMPSHFPPSARRLLDYLVSHANSGGWVTGKTAGIIAGDLGITRRQLYRARGVLIRGGLIAWFARNGSDRGIKIALKTHKRVFRNALAKRVSSTCDITNKSLKDIKNNLKNAQWWRIKSLSFSEKSQPSNYQLQESSRVILIKGARFYRHVMKSIRLTLERYVPDISDTIEATLGDLIDKRSLEFAREAFARVMGHLGYIARAAKRLTQKSIWLLCRAIALGIAKFRRESEDMKRKDVKKKEYVMCRICGGQVDLRDHVDFCHFSCYRREMLVDQCTNEKVTNVPSFEASRVLTNS